MKIIIDRFEGDYAVCEMENLKIVNIPKELVPSAQEGDIIKIDVLKDETKKRKEEIKKLMDNIFEN